MDTHSDLNSTRPKPPTDSPEIGNTTTGYYYWLVVAACFGVTITLGETFWSFGVFFKPLEGEFGWSRTTISSAYTAFLIGYAISVMASGRLGDRYNVRPILLISAVLAGAGICLCSRVHGINQLRLYLFVTGLGAGATWSIPVSVVQRWFTGRRDSAMALAIVTAGVGVGALVFAPLINLLILKFGWRNAYLSVGIIFFLVIFLSSLVLKAPPAQGSRASLQQSGSTNAARFSGWSTREVLANPAFLTIIGSVCVSVLAFQVICVHLVPHATDMGISSTTAAAALGFMGGFSIPGRITSGLLSGKTGWQKMLSFSLLGTGVSLLWLLFLKSTWMLYFFVFLYGMCHGCRIPANFGILTEFFGLRSVGELVGITSATAMLVGAFAPYLAGFIYDTTGSYTAAFIVVIALLWTASLIILLMKKPPTTSH